MIFLPAANIAFEDMIVSELFSLMHWKAFGVTEILIEVVLIWLLMDQIFLPRGAIFLPMVLKLLFLKDFGVTCLIAIIYCTLSYNMVTNIALYDQTVLILKFINGICIKNAMKIVICRSELNVEKFVFGTLFEYSVIEQLLLSIIHQRVMVYYVQKSPGKTKMLHEYISLSVTIQNDICGHYHSPTIDIQSIFNDLSRIYDDFVDVEGHSILDLYNINTYLNKRQDYCNITIIGNAASNGVCFGTTLLKTVFEKLFAIPTWFGSSQRCWAIIHSVCLIFQAFIALNNTIINNLKKNIPFDYLFDVLLERSSKE